MAPPSKSSKNLNQGIKFLCECDKCGETTGSKYMMAVHIGAVHLGHRPFQCITCKARFVRAGALRIHMVSIHNKEHFECDICELKMTQKINLTKHISVVHLKIRPFKCNECRARFSELASLQKHKAAIHMNRKPHICDQCHKGYNDKPDLADHCLRMHVKSRIVHKAHPDPLTCDQCGVRFARWKADLIAHIQRKHQGHEKLKCQLCNAQFDRLAILHSHMNMIHRDIQLTTCDQCEKMFKHKALLLRHISRTHLHKTLQCGLCTASFSRQENVVKHRARVHEHKVTPHVECDLCGAQFTRANLAIHFNSVHSNQRRFKCHQCNAAFGRTHHLKGHLESVHNTSVKSFLCDLCLKLFHSKDYLATHYSVIHMKSRHWKVRESKTSMECDQCGTTFNQRGSFIYHFNSAHVKERHYKCNQCDAAFSHSGGLKQHKRGSHALELMCDCCSKTFKRKDLLASHYSGIHMRSYRFKCHVCGKKFLYSNIWSTHKKLHR